MDQEKVLSIARKYASAVREIVDAAAIFLYGSCARGTASAESDIDIAVVVDEVPDDYLGAVAALWRLTRCVDSAIEPVLLTEADNDSGFLQTVRRTGIAV